MQQQTAENLTAETPEAAKGSSRTPEAASFDLTPLADVLKSAFENRSREKMNRRLLRKSSCSAHLLLHY